ncbi:hypothetical protein WR25_04999 [Diploscapter pachys]|uniref:Galactosylgalactosylxylosylprotein 3-beta-glucuronosyltransferase n=1 Tax=Diploscapter pachys TaxID=2018661 RepID=A0A2A2J502_9BILA|nr:hypothetical protein WR25_04999 [Diploscapter pachys]
MNCLAMETNLKSLSEGGGGCEETPIEFQLPHFGAIFGLCDWCLARTMSGSLLERWWLRAVVAIGLFFLCQMALMMSKVQNLDDEKITLQAEVASLSRRCDELRMEILTKERDVVRMQARAEQLELSVRDKLSLSSNVRRNAPVIYFVTPTAFRPAQKADLTRLSYTLSHVPNLHWIVVEDSEEISNSVEEILRRAKVKYTHLNTLTNPQMKMKFSDPNWYLPRGVEQRNAALEWIRRQLSGASSGVVYFGDDDNTYDLRLFEEIRNVKTAGIWPVGIVGGLFVETPSLDSEGKVQKFNAIWKTERPFPIDMAAFALHISLILKNPKTAFTYNVARGYQESHFLSSLNLLPSDLQPLAQNCTKVYVWHTRTEKSVLSKSNQQRLAEYKNAQFTKLETDALGLDFDEES